MVKKITVTGNAARRIDVTGRPQRRIEAAEFAAALGAEPCGEAHAANLDPLALAELGHELIKRLRSSGGRPALSDATARCKVPLSPDDLEALETIATQVQRDTGSKPSVGQIASVILRAHLDSLKHTSAAPPGNPQVTPIEPMLSLNTVKQLIEEQLQPLREKVTRLESDLHAR